MIGSELSKHNSETCKNSGLLFKVRQVVVGEITQILTKI